MQTSCRGVCTDVHQIKHSAFGPFASLHHLRRHCQHLKFVLSVISEVLREETSSAILKKSSL
nr:MAG TPA_asm: hypothetical protein [Caudoviricetes sp.]